MRRLAPDPALSCWRCWPRCRAAAAGSKRPDRRRSLKSRPGAHRAVTARSGATPSSATGWRATCEPPSWRVAAARDELDASASEQENGAREQRAQLAARTRDADQARRWRASAPASARSCCVAYADRPRTSRCSCCSTSATRPQVGRMFTWYGYFGRARAAQIAGIARAGARIDALDDAARRAGAGRSAQLRRPSSSGSSQLESGRAQRQARAREPAGRGALARRRAWRDCERSRPISSGCCASSRALDAAARAAGHQQRLRPAARPARLAGRGPRRCELRRRARQRRATGTAWSSRPARGAGARRGRRAA